jgi:tight adherence protein B
MPLQVLVGLVFIVSTAVLMGIFVLISRRSQSAQSRTLEKRLSEATGMVGPSAADLAGGSLLRKEAAGPLPNIDRVARQALKGSALERWIEQSGTGISAGSCILTSLVIGATLGFLAMSFVGRPWAVLLGFLLGICIVPMVLRQKRASRLYKFEETFPEALDLLSRGIRAGHAFTAGMKMVADELHEPVGPEFRKAFDEQNFGLPLKESLNNLCLRVPILDVRFFSTAVLIQRETGGNLSEILDNLAAVVRERFKIRRQVRVHTAHGRFTGYVLMALPAFLAFALSFINPEHMNRLFEERLGQMMIIASIIMQAVGFFWIKQVIKIEV